MENAQPAPASDMPSEEEIRATQLLVEELEKTLAGAPVRRQIDAMLTASSKLAMSAHMQGPIAGAFMGAAFGLLVQASATPPANQLH